MKDIIELFEKGMDRKVPEFKDGHWGYDSINLGAGNKNIAGAESIDYPEWDADLSPIPRADESIGTIYAFHFLEHVQEPVKVLQEMQRVLVKGGVANIVVPYYSSQMAAHDLDHKHVFCEETWKTLFNCPYYNKNRIEWEFEIGFNMIMGVAERNLALVTQLIKV